MRDVAPHPARCVGPCRPRRRIAARACARPHGSAAASRGQRVPRLALERAPVGVEQMAVLGLRAHAQHLARAIGVERRNARDQPVGRDGRFRVQIRGIAERFDGHRPRDDAVAARHADMQMLGPDADRHALARAQRRRVDRGALRLARFEAHERAVGRCRFDDAREKVHLRRADEARDELVRRRVIQRVGRAHLLHAARRQHDDLVGERHRLDLIVRHVDHRRLQLVVQPRELEPHLHAQRRIEVRQRLVEQEHLRLARDRAADRDALPLPARQLPGLPVEQVIDMQDPRRLLDRVVDLLLLRARELQAERHVVVERHVRIERVRLEHHRDAALRARHVVDLRAVDQQLAARNLLEPRDHPHQRGFAAAARPDEHDELAVDDVEIDVAQHFVVVVALADIAQEHACHDLSPFSCAAARRVGRARHDRSVRLDHARLGPPRDEAGQLAHVVEHAPRADCAQRVDLPRRRVAAADEAEHRHAGRRRGRHAGRAVLDDETLRRRDAERLRGGQIDVGRGLRPRDAVRAEQALAEEALEARAAQRGVDVMPAAVARACDRQVDSRERRVDAVDDRRLNRGRLDAAPNRFDIRIGERAARARARAVEHALGAQSEQRQHDRPRRDARPARLELAHEHVGRDRLAVDQHAVAIADEHARVVRVRRHLTAPNVRPRTSCFCDSHPTTRIGATASSDAADSFAQKSPSGLEYDAMNTVSGAAFELDRLMLQNASFHDRITSSNAVDARPGSAIGISR
ncbi:hypothetical protein BURPS1710b_1039 [Burkholderia pseudomallei 1710b]|uniref:Uncharacterized protein n=1 Tax=Burkholderia pseudomallei (strain 1710b) TaxID=320372 RepID=Q3JVF3_BURP1|nr:hypothetical protein BURPS1710b_1039 [Burkholderia pseudomallei 1710b]